MTDQTNQKRSRRTTVVILVVLAAVVVAAAIGGVIASTGAARPIAGASSTAAGSSGTDPSAGATPSASTGPTSSPTSAAPSTASTPQATRTATITKPTQVPISKDLTATVVRMEAVSGTADGPGEVAGPSVRFTIRITNTTGSSFSLANTVVNAYYGASASPATQLRQPGGKDFPSTVANGASATGVFVFNIPRASRSQVEVTVDTSVRNPVIAFKGAAPTS